MSASVEGPLDLSRMNDQPQEERWGLPSRIAFRFCFLYLGLFCLLTQIGTSLLPVPGVDLPDLDMLPPLRQVVFWTARHVFGYSPDLIYRGSGSGDKVFDWVTAFCTLVLAVLGAGVWSRLDRRRPNYDRLYAWLRVFIRFALAGQMLVYGFSKVIPMQMPFPRLTRLLEPYGNFSPMGVLWASIGAAPAYERFVGSAELLAGVLLIVPTTTMLGAVICLIDMTEVFVLNMTYDVPVKLFSFHLMVMPVFLLIPERWRLLRFCFANCTVEPSATSTLFATRRANRVAVSAQIALGVILIAANLISVHKFWFIYGGGAPKSPLYGIWNVDEMAVDGKRRSPLLTDYGRWRRVVFEFPQTVMFERMNDTFAPFGCQFDAKRGALALTRNGDKNWSGQLGVQRVDLKHITLDGKMGADTVHMQLSLMDSNNFLLISRGFHWIQEYPFNR